MMQSLTTFLCSDEGAVSVEYSIILMVILMTILAAVQIVGVNTNGMWQSVVTNFTGSHVGNGP
jgi:Flp pilus assembly pilin Flp